VAGSGRQQSLSQIDLDGIPQREQRRGERHQHEQRDEGASGNRQRIAEDTPQRSRDSCRTPRHA
jgi:hypothetical protein